MRKSRAEPRLLRLLEVFAALSHHANSPLQTDAGQDKLLGLRRLSAAVDWHLRLYRLAAGRVLVDLMARRIKGVTRPSILLD